MVDIRKLIQEFLFLSEQIKNLGYHLSEMEYSQASFLAGSISAICENHAGALQQLLPPPPPAPAPIVEELAKESNSDV